MGEPACREEKAEESRGARGRAFHREILTGGEWRVHEAKGHRDFVPEKNFRVIAYKAVQEKSLPPFQRKTSERCDKPGNKGDFSLEKSSFSVTPEDQVNIRMYSFDKDLV